MHMLSTQESWDIAKMTVRRAIIWVPWKIISGVLDYAHGYFAQNF